MSVGGESLQRFRQPGIGCPVIAASAGADLALLVVEPTVSGAHDLERILATTNHFGLPALVCINKADINPSRADEIAAFCAAQGVAVAGQVPYDTVVTEAMVQGLPVPEYDHAGGVCAAIVVNGERLERIKTGEWQSYDASNR